MRRRIDMTGLEFRVGGRPLPRRVSRQNQTQRTTRDGRPVWVVKLSAYDEGVGEGTTEEIWVELAGEEPVLKVNGIALVTGLVHAPWVNNAHELVESFRAEAIVMADGPGRRTV